MEDCCFILNPFARRARLGHVHEILPRLAHGATVYLTEKAGDAQTLARQAAEKGFKTIVAAGGDGTVNEVVRGLVGSQARLGILPLGTVNVFARELGLPLDWEEALLRLRTPRPFVLDLGKANDTPFVQLAGMGFDADAIAAVDSASKRAWGPLAYVAAGLRVLAQPRRQLHITPEGFPPMEAPWVLVGLGRYYGGPFPVFPKANPVDGLLDVLILEKLSALDCLPWLWTVPWGGHTRLRGVHYFQTSALTVEGRGWLELDGELHAGGKVRFTVSPGALRVVL